MVPILSGAAGIHIGLHRRRLPALQAAERCQLWWSPWQRLSPLTPWVSSLSLLWFCLYILWFCAGFCIVTFLPMMYSGGWKFININMKFIFWSYWILNLVIFCYYPVAQALNGPNKSKNLFVLWVVSHQGGFSSGSSLIGVVFHCDGLSLRQSLISILL